MSPEEELEAVNAELIVVENEIQSLLQQKERLVNKQQRLRATIKGAKASAAASTDWENTNFPWSQELRETLLSTFKINSLRPFQLSTMNATLSGQDCILIMPTGGGKSLCFQLPALLNKGITLVVTPLVSLMEDQFMALKALKIPVRMINASSSKAAIKSIFDAMTGIGELKILYVTPEKLAKSKTFMTKLQYMYKLGLFARLAVDEVHCCSQWGHDFRPDYKFLGIMKRQFPRVPILGLTATATSQVVHDVQKILNIEGCLVLKATFNRPNLYYEVRSKPSAQKEVVDEIEKLLKQRFNGLSGIIYCFAIRESEELAKDLKSRGIKAGCYHANLDAKVRSEVHQKWMADEIQVVVATIAFGMGIDKPNVRFVIHHSISRSMENFYQESGRAGRDDQLAYCILFYRLADIFRQSTMVFTEQTGLDNLYAMARYCTDIHRCRRSMIASHFGENWEENDCKRMCDHCDRLTQVEVASKDITSHCKEVFMILDKAQSIDQQLTGQQLIDVWMGKGAVKLRSLCQSTTNLSKDACERILCFMLVEGYLKENFHFTPYATISYLKLGMRGNSVINGKLTVEIEMVERQKPKTSLSSTSPKSGRTYKRREPKLKKNRLKPCVINSPSHFVEEEITHTVSEGTDMTDNLTEVKNSIKTETTETKKITKRVVVIDVSSEEELDFGENLEPPLKRKTVIKKEVE